MTGPTSGFVPNQEMERPILAAAINFVDDLITVAVFHPVTSDAVVLNNAPPLPCNQTTSIQWILSHCLKKVGKIMYVLGIHSKWPFLTTFFTTYILLVGLRWLMHQHISIYFALNLMNTTMLGLFTQGQVWCMLIVACPWIHETDQEFLGVLVLPSYVMFLTLLQSSKVILSVIVINIILSNVSTIHILEKNKFLSD